jgi:hypothetical protein
MSLVRHVFCGVALAAIFLVTAIVSACDPNCLSPCIKYTGCDGTCKQLYGINFTDPAHPCAPCSRGCISPCNIKGAGTCDSKCGIGYCFIKANFSCVAVAHCNNCTNGTLPCSACAPGYRLVDEQCIQCDKHCLYDNCTVSDSCSEPECVPGYMPVLSPSTPSVYICAPCGKQCNGTCDEYGAGTCDGPCEMGWALNDQTHQCAECSHNCTIAGCNDTGPGYCDCPCDPGFNCSSSATDPFHRNACYPCDIHCAGNCAIDGPGFCDNSTSLPCLTGYKLAATSEIPPRHYCILI